MLFESLALRIAAQSAISLVLAPLAAAFAVAHAGELQLGVSMAEAARACVPSRIVGLLTEGAAVAALAGVTVAVLVPFTVSLVDEFYLLKASAKAKRALKAARSRDLARNEPFERQQRASPGPKGAPPPKGQASVERRLSVHSVFDDRWHEAGGLGGVGEEVEASELKS